METPPRQKVTVSTVVPVTREQAWVFWVTPEHIEEWNAASYTWSCPSAVNDLQVGGKFDFHMVAKDDSMGFHFTGKYTEVVHHERIAYTMDDGRTAEVVFEDAPEGAKITETFDTESENPVEMQRNGWQAILDHYKNYIEKKNHIS